MRHVGGRAWLLAWALIAALLVGGISTVNAQPVPPNAPAALPAQDARRALEILRDDARRAELISALEAIAAAAPPAAAPSPLALTPESLGARLAHGASELMDRVLDHAQETLFAVGDLPWLGRWVLATLTDPLLRWWLLGVLWRLVLVLGIGLALAWLVARALRPMRVALGARMIAMAEQAAHTQAADGLDRAELGDLEAPQNPVSPGYWNWRVPVALGRLGLQLAPIGAFLVATHLALATPLGGSRLTQLVIIAMIQAGAAWRVALAGMDALAAPGVAPARLLAVSDETAVWLVRWTSRLALILLFASASLHAALLLGLPRPAHSGWLKLSSLVIALCLVVMVIQRRRAVAAWLRGAAADGAVRAVLAPVWHWMAMIAILAVWLVWTLEHRAGGGRILPPLILTLLVLVLARLASAGLAALLERVATRAMAREDAYPGITQRVSGYRRLTRGVVGLLFTVIAGVVLAEAWGVDALAWLANSATGRELLGGLGTILVALLLALLAWEGLHLGLTRHMARLAAREQAARAARLRTLLPMMRAVLQVSLFIILGLTILSRIGINIAPLLAGAGVLGIALGLGSQKLVQDVVTGLFLLLENAMQVGDVVTLAGVTGVVEELSIRSIRVRTEDGSVQIIPFSAVTSVTNMTRDFSQAVLEVQLGHGQDYDEVVALLNEMVAEMRADPLWAGDILADLEVMGLVKFEAAGVTLKCRLRCGPFARWRVLRELHRRMRGRFTEMGVDWVGA